MRKELRKQIEPIEQKMSKSPNNMNNGGSHFLYHREQIPIILNGSWFISWYIWCLKE